MTEELTEQHYKDTLDRAVREAADILRVSAPADVRITNDPRIRGEYNHAHDFYEVSRAAIRELPPEELRALVGHELRHEEHSDSLSAITGPLQTVSKYSGIAAVMAGAWGAITAVGSLVVEQLGMNPHWSIAETLAATTALTGTMAMGSYLTSQATLRHYEYDADKGAVEATTPEIVASWLTRKAEYNMPFEEHRAEILDDHPTLEHRVAAVMKQKSNSAPLPDNGFAPEDISVSGSPSHTRGFTRGSAPA